MREILFRGKDTNENDWVYGSLLITEISFFIVQHMEGFIYQSPVIPETVGQYTGIDDVNGNKIFEGDIVRLLYDGDYITTAGNGVIEYLPGGFEAYYKKDAIKSSYNFEENRYQHEIVGNTTDNPELLK